MPAHKPDLTGYTYIKEIVDDHWDKYINNQHSGTHKAFNDVVKLARAARDPAEQRAQVEQETGWEYHPQDTRYARRKRHTSNNLVPP